MTHSMEEIIRTIDGYIEHLEDSISTGDSKKAENLQTEIIAVFEPEIDGLKVNLDNYNVSHLYLNNPVDYIGDAKLLKAKLQNYKLNLASGLYKPFQGADGAGTVTVGRFAAAQQALYKICRLHCCLWPRCKGTFPNRSARVGRSILAKPLVCRN